MTSRSKTPIKQIAMRATPDDLELIRRLAESFEVTLSTSQVMRIALETLARERLGTVGQQRKLELRT